MVNKESLSAGEIMREHLMKNGRQGFVAFVEDGTSAVKYGGVFASESQAAYIIASTLYELSKMFKTTPVALGAEILLAVDWISSTMAQAEAMNLEIKGEKQ